MTHAWFPQESATRLGITDGLVRISVGIEDVEDLLADLDQALAAVTWDSFRSRSQASGWRFSVLFDVLPTGRSFVSGACLSHRLDLD